MGTSVLLVDSPTGSRPSAGVTEVSILVEALARLCRGEAVVDPEVVSVAIGRGRRRNALSRLTEREQEILALMAQARSSTATCSVLHLSPKTVETHVRVIVTTPDLLPAPDDRVLAVLTHLRG